MITAIDSELPGLISAQVRENVYDSKTGRYLLIPKGSRLIGLYKNDVAYGQSRVLVAWGRLIFPDTTSIDLQNMSGADVEGGAGVAGTVDNHYGKIFGAAILTSILAAGVQLASPQNSSILTAPSSGQVVGQAVGQQIASVGTQILQKNLNVPPTLHIPKGYPFIVVVDRDIVFSGPYVSER
jgi:type IV secretion system protein VirB10